MIDASDPFHAERRDEVDEVIASIGAGEIPTVRVYNKIDLTDRDAGLETNDAGLAERAFVSALTGAGLESLVAAIDDRLSGERVRRWIRLDGKDARLRARLFEMGAVSEERIGEDGGWSLHVDMPVSMAERLARRGGHEGRVVQEQLLPDVTTH